MVDAARYRPPESGRLHWPQALPRVLLVLLAVQFAAFAGFYHWNIALGVLFLGFWWLPPRWWWLLALGNILQYSVGSPLLIDGMHWRPEHVLGYWASWLQFACGNVMPAFAAMAGAACLRYWGNALDQPADTASMTRLHLAALASATVQTLKDLAYVLDEGQIGDVRQSRIVDMVALGGPDDTQLLIQFALNHFIGGFVGIMLLAPLAMWWSTRHGEPRNRDILTAGARYLLPMIAVYLAIAGPIDSVQLSETFRLLLLVAIVLFALRFGWRGAALATLSVSVAVAVQDHLGDTHASPILLQSFIAISGAMGLLFGAAIDDNRSQAHALVDAGRAGERMRQELAAAAAGNLDVEERERQRIAGDLHDEFGQNLTALQTHLHLMQPDFRDAGKGPALDQLMDLTRAMRHNIRDVLERLRPAALDELGLYGAIERGGIRHLAEDAGLAFGVQLQGDARLLAMLGDTHRIAAYRLVQESVTNIVRHAHASRACVRLRIERRHDALWLFVDVRDDGIGGGMRLRHGNGLATMQGRVTALGGRLHVSDALPGLRVHALLRQPLVG